jgi:hypothetical protein
MATLVQIASAIPIPVEPDQEPAVFQPTLDELKALQRVSAAIRIFDRSLIITVLTLSVSTPPKRIQLPKVWTSRMPHTLLSSLS